MNLPEIKDYTLIKPIGRGGMADVYLAIQESFHREVAIKVFTPRFISDPTLSKRFIREANIASRLQHPNIIPVYDVKQEEDLFYIVMEYLPDGDLKQKFENGITVSEALKVLTQILSALQYASEKGIIHRDIKPENILFRGGSFPVLSDFGIARSNLTETQVTLTGSIMGTPRYMSPEQAQGAELDGRSDLYSVGVILFELLAGYAPYSSDSAISTGLRHITQPIPRLPKDIAAYQSLIDKALAKSPDDRFQSGNEFIEAIYRLESKLSRKPQLLSKICMPSLTEGNSSSGSAKIPSASLPSLTGNNLIAQSSNYPATLRTLLTLILGITILIGGGSYLAFREAPPSRTTIDHSLSQQASLLLAKAETAILEERYLTPAGNNAQDYLTAVLAINSEHEIAIKKMEALVAIYLSQVNLYIEQHNFDKAREVLSIARKNQPFVRNLKLNDKLQVTGFLLSQKETNLRQEEQKQVQISDLLSQAEINWKTKNLFSPPSENPLQIVVRVLEIAPNHKKAQSLLFEIQEHIVTETGNLINSNKLTDADELLKLGYQSQLDSDLLTELEKKRASKGEEFVKTSIAKGQQAITDNRPFVAYQHYIEAKEINDNDPEVLELGNAINSNIQKVLNKLIKERAYQQAEYVLQNALQLAQQGNIAISLNKLIAFEQRLQNAQSAQQKTASKINSFLRQANQLTLQKKIYEPKEKNALKLYLAALSLSPTNTEAKTGLSKSVETGINDALRHANEGQIKHAKTIIQALREHIPTSHPINPRLKKTLNEINTKDKIQTLMSEAEQLALKEEPDSASLTQIYHQLLNLNKHDSFALTKIHEASTHTLKKINIAIAKYDVEGAKDHLTHLRSYSVAPELWTSIEDRIAKTESTHIKVTSYLTQADQQVSGINLNQESTDIIKNLELAALNLTSATQVAPFHPALQSSKVKLAKHYAQIIEYFIQQDSLKSAEKIEEMARKYQLSSAVLNHSLAKLSAYRTTKSKKKNKVRNFGVF